MERAAPLHPGELDVRRVPRLAADLLLSRLLMKGVASSGDYTSLIKRMSSARHLRAPVQGRYSSEAAGRHHQCTERTGQRALALWRDAYDAQLRSGCLALLRDLERVSEGPVELNQFAFQYLLELEGWNVSHIVRNQVLRSLVEDGWLSCRDQRELQFYRRARPLENHVESVEHHLSRALGMLSSSVVQRLDDETPGMLSFFHWNVPAAWLQEFARRSYAGQQAVLERFATPVEALAPGEEAVWARFSFLAGPCSPLSLEDAGLCPLPFSYAVLAGDISHLIGDVQQGEQVMRHYLIEEARSRADEAAVGLGDYLAAHCGLVSRHTWRRWQEAPLLLSATAAEQFTGGAAVVLADELVRTLAAKYPQGCTRPSLQRHLQASHPFLADARRLIELAFAFLESDPRIKRQRVGTGKDVFVLRAPIHVREPASMEESLSLLRGRLGWLPSVVTGVLKNHPSSAVGSRQFVMRLDCMETVVLELRRVWNRLVDEMKVDALSTPDERGAVIVAGQHSTPWGGVSLEAEVVPHSGENAHLVLNQLCVTPFYPERMGPQ